MPVLTLAPTDRTALHSALADPRRLVVVTLCAAWCDTCTQFRVALERIAAARSGMTFVWLDIEDDSATCDDIDVENFPTLAVYHGRTPLHFGVSLPHEGTVARLVDALAERPAPLADAPAGVTALPAKIGGG